jgi:hypothetical protein
LVSPKGRDHLDNLGIDGRIISEWLLGNRVGRCGLDTSESCRDQWQALVNMVMNLYLGSIKGGDFLD